MMSIVTQAVSMPERLVPILADSLNRLPLHQNTLQILDDKLKQKSVDDQFIEAMSHMVLRYENAVHRNIASDKKKILESLIYHTYFIWNNPLPEHLQKFKRYYREILMFWPYERHRSLLSMDNPKKSSIRYRWSDCNSIVLSMMKYEKNPWMTYRENNSQTEIAEFKQALRGTHDATHLPNRHGTLTSIERDTLLNSIFTHYLFLKSNSRLCKNGKSLPVPIVEIPLRPLGQDVADIRVRNIFKRKVASTWNILAIENPVLSAQNEQALFTIISEANERSLCRLYQRACKRAYVIDKVKPMLYADIGGRLPSFKASSLLLKNI